MLVVQKKAFANTGKVIDLFAAMRGVIYAQFGSKQVNVVHAYLYILKLFCINEHMYIFLV